MARTALVAGATGLIGNQVVALLLNDVDFEKVIVLSRKPLAVTHPKLEVVLVEVDEWTKLQHLKADAVFCCLGTTIKQAKTQAAFRKVDFEYPVELAKALRQNGAEVFLLVSALGADPRARIFYNRVKGEAEAAIKELNYSATYIFRPSLLLGERKEQRSGEDAAKIFYKIFGPIIPQKYQAIDAGKVARAMVSECKLRKRGLQVYESAFLQQY